MASGTRLTARKSAQYPTNGGEDGQCNATNTRQKEDRRCMFCSKTFTKTEHLLRHQRSHTKEKPFRCAECGKAYSRHDTLLRHAKLHTAEWSQANTTTQPPGSGLENPRGSLPMSQKNRQQVLAAGVSSDDQETQSSVASNNLQSPSNQSSETDTDMTGQLSSTALHIHSSVPLVDFNPINGLHNRPQLSGNNSFAANGGTVQNQNEQAQLLQNDFSIAMINASSAPLHANNNLWDPSLVSPGPSWWIGYDFDLDALNTSVSATMDMDEPLFQPQMQPNIIQDIPRPDLPRRAEAQRKQKSVNDIIKRSWFTQLDDVEADEDLDAGTTTGQMTPATEAEQYDLDDNFRTRVSLKLRPRTNDDPLPSTNYLNLSVQVYFTKFNTIFPVIHGQTFRPTPKNSLLLLSICSIGSLLVGSKGAAAQGTRIFERLNKAILASWENTVLKDPAEATSMIQAALVGQTFGLLSGDPKHLAIVEAFHGTVIAWARRCKMFKYRNNIPQVEGLSTQELSDAWKRWGRHEEIVRTVLGLYIHDVELARMFHHEPLLRHDAIVVSVAADDNLFNAPTAAAWRDQLRLQPHSKPSLHQCLHTNLQAHHYSQPLADELICRPSRFTAYVILHGIFASVCEKQQIGHLKPASENFNKYIDALLCWCYTFELRNSNHHAVNTSQSDSFCLIVLWHTVFMSLLVNFNILERVIGRDGLDTASTDPDYLYVMQWAVSVEAQRCIMHAHALQSALGNMRLDTEPAIHIPHCLFLAGIASYCYTRFCRSSAQDRSSAQASASASSSGQTSSFPEFNLRGVAVPGYHVASPFDTTAVAPPGDYRAFEGGEEQYQQNRRRSGAAVPAGASMLCTLTDMLQRIGHWGIARKFAGILGTLVQADTDEDWMLI